MEEVEGDEERKLPELSQPSFLEVACKSSGKNRRFAVGTKAGFALYMMNHKLGVGFPPSLHIEAVKEGEEPVSFGPNADLVNYGHGWMLQTVTEEGYEEANRMHVKSKPLSSVVKPSKFQPLGERIWERSSNTNSLYMWKILVAFAFIFLLGGTLAIFLENLPRIVMFVTSSM